MPATLIEFLISRVDLLESIILASQPAKPRFTQPKCLGLSGVEWRILERLCERAPDTVSLEELIALLPRGNQADTLRHHVFRVRAKVMPYDVAIVTDHSRGYRVGLVDVDVVRGLS